MPPLDITHPTDNDRRAAVVDGEPLTIVADRTDDQIDGQQPVLPVADREDGADQVAEANITELRAKPSLNDIERDAIGERYAARRAAQLGIQVEKPAGAEDGSQDGTQNDTPRAENGAGAGADDGRPPAAAPRLNDSPDQRRHKLKVNGAEVEVGEAELIRIAQEGLATGITLEEAKRLRNEARGLPRSTAAAEHQGDDPADRSRTTDRNDPAPAKTRLDPARLAATVEKLQVGTMEEATEALQDFAADLLTARGDGQAPDLDTSVEKVIERREAAGEAKKALAKFATEFKPLAEDPDLADLVVKQTAREIYADLKRIGVPAEDLAAVENNPQLLISGYRTLRDQVNPATGRPWGLRGYDEILTASGHAVAKKFGIVIKPQPGAEQGATIRVGSERTAAKAALTQQPRSAGLPADAGRLSGSTSQAPQRMSGKDVVEAERRARGFAA